MRQGWTPEEDSYIRENFARLSDQQIADKLGRTLRSIQHRRKRLGIVKQPLSRWTAKEDQLIRGSIDRGEARNVSMTLRQLRNEFSVAG